MWTWLFSFLPAFGMAKGLTDCITAAFNPNNMVPDQITGRTNYSVRGANYRTYTLSLRAGMRINNLSLLIMLASIALVILSFFFAEQWWQGIIAILGGFFLRAIFRLFGDVQFRSTLYYVEVIACPVLLILSYLALFMNR